MDRRSFLKSTLATGALLSLSIVPFDLKNKEFIVCVDMSYEFLNTAHRNELEKHTKIIREVIQKNIDVETIAKDSIFKQHGYKTGRLKQLEVVKNRSKQLYEVTATIEGIA